MKLNWRPNRVAYIDFETQSECELTTVHKYTTDPTTNVLTCVLKVDGVTHRMGPYMTAEHLELLTKVAQTHTLVAHNAPFDAGVWENTLKLPEAEWFDTLPPSRAAGLPGKLDDVGMLLTGEGKDKRGKQLIDMLCIIRNGKYPRVGPAHQLLLDYNQRDVELLEQIHGKVAPFVEPDVMTVDRVINDRGIPINRDFLNKLMHMYDTNSDKLGAEFAERTGGVNPNSPKQVKDWMKASGFKVPTLNGVESLGKFAYKDFLAKPEEYYVGDGEEDAAVEAMLDIMELRREVVRVGKGKAKAALEAIEHDDTAREQFVYWGAHTGRWAGRKLQLHNMPKADDVVKAVDVRGIEPTYENAVALAKEAAAKIKQRVLVADVLGCMLRHMVQAENMLVADFGAVEARCVAWVSDEMKMLTLYSDPEQSVYLDMGEQLFGRRISKKADPQEYTMSKTLVLGCGYGMSGAKFEYTCKSRGISTAVFDKAGMKPSEAVKVYRTTYPRIPAVWKEYHQAIHYCLKGVPMEAGKCKFYMVGPDMRMELPSGRCIVYRNARIEMRIPGYAKLYGMPEEPVETVVFDLPRMFGDRCKTGFLYGSKVAENACQGICRDILAEKLVHWEQAGLVPFLHVHDEGACLAGENRFKEFMEIMSVPPTWAPGFPLLAEGYSGPVWSKQTRGYKELNAICGRTFGG